MARCLFVVALSVCTGTASCAAPTLSLPPVQTVQLGLLRADYRDYRAHDICTSEPRWLLDELRSPLAVVNAFVRTVSQAPDSEWSDESIRLVEEAAKVLPPLLEALRANLAAARRCSFRGQPGFEALLRDGPARCQAAARALALVPDLVAHVRARRTRARWQAERPARESQARRTCRGETASVFYASEACDGTREWLFCDRARVTMGRDQRAEWLPGPSSLSAPSRRPRRGRAAAPKPTAGSYLSAAKAFGDLDRCPAVPPAPAIPP